MKYICKAENRPSRDLVDKIANFSTATLHEAYDRRGALPSVIKPITQGLHLTGPAVTVELRPGDNLMLHKAIYEAEEGDILVVDAKGFTEAGIWGDIMTCAAMQRGINGLVVYGSVRDKKEIIESGFPVFTSGICIRGTIKTGPGFINKQIAVSDIIIEPGDVIRGDSDGVVVIKYSDLETVIVRAEAIVNKEEMVKKKLKEGLTTLEIYKFDALSKYVQ